MGPTELGWYCVRSQPKHEHVAAASLRQFDGIQVFSPRLRVRRATRRGPVWFNESLFPTYLFARFALQPQLDTVRHARGVAGVVHFGDRWPAIPDATLAELREAFGDSEIREVRSEFRPGDSVEIASGPFRGFLAIVETYIPGPQRIRVLLEMLGRTVPVVLPETDVLLQEGRPHQVEPELGLRMP